MQCCNSSKDTHCLGSCDVYNILPLFTPLFWVLFFWVFFLCNVYWRPCQAGLDFARISFYIHIFEWWWISDMIHAFPVLVTTSSAMHASIALRIILTWMHIALMMYTLFFYARATYWILALLPVHSFWLLHISFEENSVVGTCCRSNNLWLSPLIKHSLTKGHLIKWNRSPFHWKSETTEKSFYNFGLTWYYAWLLSAFICN